MDMTKGITGLLKRLALICICLIQESGGGIYLPYAALEFTKAAINGDLCNVLVLALAEEQQLNNKS